MVVGGGGGGGLESDFSVHLWSKALAKVRTELDNKAEPSNLYSDI